jgi:hypothetical protein
MNILSTIRPFLSKHEPEILMSMGICGLIFSTVWGVKATVQATKMVEKKESDTNKKLGVKDIVATTWKLYIPVVASMIVSVPCIIASDRVSSKRYAAMATAYTLSETALQEYQDKAKEIVGEKKDKEIKEAISKDNVDKTYTGNNQIIMTGDGDSLFFEPLSGRYFKSNWNTISKAANELNATAMSSMEGEISLNDWFEALNLPRTDIGDSIGWDIKFGPKHLIDIEISSHITKDNIPCGAIAYNNQPKPLGSAY